MSDKYPAGDDYKPHNESEICKCIEKAMKVLIGEKAKALYNEANKLFRHGGKDGKETYTLEDPEDLRDLCRQYGLGKDEVSQIFTILIAQKSSVELLYEMPEHMGDPEAADEGMTKLFLHTPFAPGDRPVVRTSLRAAMQIAKAQKRMTAEEAHAQIISMN